MVSEINRQNFLETSEEFDGLTQRPVSYSLQEKIFRKYYPELFDERVGHDFIKSLNLKMRCDDYNKPRLL